MTKREAQRQVALYVVGVLQNFAESWNEYQSRFSAEDSLLCEAAMDDFYALLTRKARKPSRNAGRRHIGESQRA